ncbi:MAG: hypothetical protein K0R75_846 [Paenibacillaceae bacterium]|jgi:hypothetical protein|nr:hypothetical protein [Paenibacillaceae bacterium]
MKKMLKVLSAALLLGSLLPVAGLSTVSAATFNATIDINTSNVTTIPYAIRGINDELQKGIVEFTDQNVIDTTKALDLGWIRWPGGTNTNFFNWKTGLTDTEYMGQVYTKTKQYYQFMDFYKQQRATQIPERLSDFNDFLQKVGAKTVITINVLDTVEKVSDLAKFVKDNNIPVLYWELTNEPYHYTNNPSLYADVNDYLDKMKPYSDAIKSILPNAKTMICYYASDANWNDAISNYPNPYWDGVNFHRYDGGGSSVTAAIKDANSVLDASNSFINNNIIAKMQDANAPIFVGEYGVALSDKLGESVYHGLFNSEGILRYVKNDNVKVMGGYRLFNGYLNPDNRHTTEAMDNFQRGIKADATQYNFGFYEVVPAIYTSVMEKALNNSSTLWGTTVTGGTTVDKTSGTMPAIYAQAMRGSYGNKNYLVIVNKSDSTHNITVNIDGSAYGGTFTKVYVNAPNDGSGNPDPVARNKSNHSLIQEQTATGVANPVSVGPYSVTRLEWTPSTAQADLAPQAPWISYANATAAGTATLKWLPADGANTYTIKYGTSPTSLNNSITSIPNTTTTKDVTGLTAGATYYFDVQAVGSTATTDSENTPSVTMATPAVPLLRSAYVERDQASIVEWQSVPGAQGYKVRYKQDAGSYGTPIDVGNVAGTLINGLTDGSTYTFEVAAYNGYGTSAWSNEDVSHPNDDLPFAPNDLQVSGALGATSATLTWKPSYNEHFMGYFEDGDGTSSGWTVSSGSAYTVVAHPDASRNTKVFKSPNSGTNVSVRGLSSFADYDVEANIRVTSYDSDGRVGLVGRFKDINNYYYLTYGKATDSIRLAKYMGGATTLLQSRTLADLANDGITPDVNDMDLRLVMKGSSLEVMVNDNSIFTVTDSSIDNGKYGVWSNQTAYFDKLIMRISETRDGTYKIYRSTQPDTGYTMIKSGATGTSYTDNTLTAGVKYYYKLKGVDALGNTSVGFSNIAPRK